MSPIIFQSKWRNANYVVRPIRRVFYPESGHTELIPGLSAKFEGNQRLFDSEKAQAKYGWADEERERVERHLINHRDWKRGLYLAYGQEIPAKFAPEAAKAKAEAPLARCQFIAAANGEIVQCEKPAAIGKDFCDQHLPESNTIKKSTVGGPAA